MHPIPRRRSAAALTLAAVLTAMVAMPVSADNLVSQTINAGTRTSSVADLTFQALNYSHSAQTSTGTMTLTADDSSGTGEGWNVTVLGSPFEHDGTGADIPAANFSITTASAATASAGQEVDLAGGPDAPLTGSTGTLDTARQTLAALAGYGQGTYTQDLGVSLSIPAQTRAGTYTGTMTVTIAAGP